MIPRRNRMLTPNGKSRTELAAIFLFDEIMERLQASILRALLGLSLLVFLPAPTDRMTQRMPIPSRLASKLFLCGVLLASMSGLALGDLQPDLGTFDQEVKPLLRKYCVRCHGSKKVEAKIRFDEINADIVTGEDFGKWEDVREAFNSGEMPPQDQRQPTPAERDVITGWLNAEFKKAKQHGIPNKRGRVRRLTRYELRYALEDLLKISVKDEVSALPEEGASVETGLKNSSRMLMISGPHLESYLNVVLSVINKMKEIAAFEPYTESLDVENLDTNPPLALTSDGRKIKPTVGNVERSGKGVIVNPKGYIDLRIPSISRYMFQTSLAVKADGPAELLVSIGFTHSEVDPRQKLADLGVIEIEKSDELRTYVLKSFPDTLPKEMTRALDRPFFVRITNRSKQTLYLETFDYQGNVNTDLIASLLPADVAESDVDDHVQQSIVAFIERAFRRSPTDAESDRYVRVYQRHVEKEGAIAALLSTYKEILCSPSFFYIGIPGELSDEAKQNYKLAERLAIFLWCSVPDDLLLQAASTGELTTPSVLASHVERMLRHEKSRRWVESFADQWLQTSKLFNVAVDKSYYPKFREPLKELMRQETIEAVNDVFRNGSPAIDLLKADHVFVNQTLAAFYQIKGVRGKDFQKVAVDEKDNRGGLLTQGTFLIGNSDGMNSHAILRGVWLAEVILNDPPPDPPKNVPALDESIPGFDKMTLNEKLFAHRNNDACKNCHRKIDPWGVPFENYDASGAWRDQVLIVSRSAGQPKKRKKPVFEKTYVGIDRVSTLPDDVTINGVGELKDYLVSRRKIDFARALTERILACALSRDIDYHDEDLVNHLVDIFGKNNHSVPTLIREIVQSDEFR